jgi:hypothetical protein
MWRLHRPFQATQRDVLVLVNHTGLYSKDTIPYFRVENFRRASGNKAPNAPKN